MDIKKVIKERGYTIEEVAKKMGISRVTLSQNMSRNPTIGTLERIANAIGCKVVDFFQDEQAPFSAIVKYNGEMKEVTSVGELERIVNEIKGDGK